MVSGVLRCVLLSLSSVLVAPTFNENLRLNADRWIARSRSHVGLGLTDEELRTVSNMEDFAQFDSALDAILVPRVPDTPSHGGVRQSIASSMRNLGWTVDEDRFTDNTPLRRDVAFTNVVATLDPLAPRRLVLACHYDSLRTTSGRFVGATDSAVPCAQLINLAHVLRGPLQQHRRAEEEVTLQFLFFDGEEAFVRWSRTDSTYGARYLANALQRTAYKDTGATGVSHLHRMDMLVLLDLLGAPNPQFYSYFPESEPLYLRLMSFERRLQAMNLTRGLPLMFQQQARYHAGIEDDHIPFLEKGVPVLHLIPTPFPRVWHKDSDNKANLHGDTIRNQNALFRALVADYLHLQL